MIEGKFDVIFRGQTMKNFEIADVKNNLMNLFKSSPEAVEKLFSGEEVVIKKSLDYTNAMKYQSALKKSGALALIKEIEASEPAAAVSPKPAAQSKPNPFLQTPASTSAPAPDQTTTPPVETSDSFQEDSGGSFKDASDDSASGLSVAEAGARILPDKVYEKRDVDTSDLSLAAVGERIMPKTAPENHVQPSIDHLSLEN